MNTVRANLTRLKNSMQEKLPDGDDIFGFAGISKKLLIACVDEAYKLSYSLSQLEPEFEITVLKRKLASLFDDCKDYLNKGTEQWGKEKKFDKFITDITNIREQVRLTYLVVVDKGLRTEVQMNKILEDYEKISKEYEKYKDQFYEIEEKYKAVNEAHKKSSELFEEIEKINEDINEINEKVVSIKSGSESSFQITSKYESEIKEKRQYVVDLANQLVSMEKKSKALQLKADENRKEFERLSAELNEQIEKNKAQQTEIQDTLDNANRMGMAGSFKSRKEELDRPITIWGVVFVLAILCIFAIGYRFVAPYVLSNKEFNYIEVLFKIALVSPFVWLAWMSVKQYGYLSRIKEDYAYKYASAMAFEGYKKHAKEIDPVLLTNLLHVSVLNLSQNPIRLYSVKDNHGSPVNEITREFASFLQNKSLNLGKAKGEKAIGANSSE